jgi:flagellar biosynthetic protein FliR
MDLGTFIVLFAKEVAVGLLLAWGIMLAFAAVQAAGQTVEVQFGFGFGAIVDPNNATETTVVAQFYATLFLLLFLMVDGHHLILRLLARSFDLIPVTAVPLSASLAAAAVDLFGAFFVWWVQLAAPFLVASLLIEAGLGLVARAVPQMNIFIVALPLKVGLGLLLIGLLAHAQLSWMEEILREAVRESLRLLQGARP